MADVNNRNGNPVIGGSGVNQPQLEQAQQAVINPANQNAAAQLAQQILSKTNVTLKQEVIKLLEFYS
jgi:hypothetical protein